MDFVKVDLNKYISKCLLDNVINDGRIISIMIESILKSEYNEKECEVRYTGKTGVNFLPAKQKGFGREENILEFKRNARGYKAYWVIFRLPYSTSFICFKVKVEAVISTEGKLTFDKCKKFVIENNKQGVLWLV